MSENEITISEFSNLVNQINHDCFGDEMDDSYIDIIHSCAYDFDFTFDEIKDVFNEAKKKQFIDEEDKIRELALFVFTCKVKKIERKTQNYRTITELTVKMDNGDEIVVEELHFDFELGKSDLVSWVKDVNSSRFYLVDYGDTEVYIQKNHIVSIERHDTTVDYV